MSLNVHKIEPGANLHWADLRAVDLHDIYSTIKSGHIRTAIVEKTVSAGGSFRSANCPHCGKINILQNQKPNTFSDKVFCSKCGRMFQLKNKLFI